jgi:transposase
MEEIGFQLPKNPEEVQDISPKELRWLLEGFSINQPKAHKKIKIPEDPCF